MSTENDTTPPGDNTPGENENDIKNNAAATDSDPFAAAIDNTGSDDAAAAEETDTGFGFEEGTFSKEAEKMMASLCDSHGLDRKKMAPFLKELVAKAREQDESDRKRSALAHDGELRKLWGANYSSRVKQVGGFIRQVGKAVGWNEDQIHSFANPDGFRLFSDIMRFVGESRAAGTAKGKTQPNPLDSMTREQLMEERRSLAKQFWNCDDADKQAELSERHAKVMSKLEGRHVAPVLVVSNFKRRK